MHDTFGERLSPINLSFCQSKTTVVGSGFEAITGIPHRGGWGHRLPEPFQGQALHTIPQPAPYVMTL